MPQCHHELPACWTSPLPPLDTASQTHASERQQQLTKPPGSLGRLEQAAIRLSGQQGRRTPSIERIAISIFAADHGVCEEGISAFPQAVTAQMIENFARGGGAINVMARQLNATLEVINLGTVATVKPQPTDQRPTHQGHGHIHHEIIASATANFTQGPAMTEAQLIQALQSGDRAAARAEQRQADLFIAGEMGIGNTTSAAALAAAILQQPAATLVGAGTGLVGDALAHKISVVELGLKRHRQARTPLSILTALGGFEIAAMASAYLGAAARRIPVLVDGFIATVAALIATRQQPELLHWLHFGHHSQEQGHQQVLTALDARPLLDLDMRLGEGSGAAVAVSVLQSACALHNGMATFAEAQVDNGQ